MSMTESYITILDGSLDKKIAILDEINELNDEQTALLDGQAFDEDAFYAITEKKAALIDKLNELDNGFQLVYDNVKAELEGNRKRYEQEIKQLQGKITRIMEKSNHIMAVERRSKEKVEKQFASRRKAVTSVKKNQQYAANYYKTMNKVTGEPVFMDKKK